MMIKMCCDRCGKDIKGTTYYTIRIYGNDIYPKEDHTVTTTTAVQNLHTNSRWIFSSEKQYCAECKSKIEKFIETVEMEED